jgi:hypothetical protein
LKPTIERRDGIAAAHQDFFPAAGDEKQLLR